MSATFVPGSGPCPGKWMLVASRITTVEGPTVRPELGPCLDTTLHGCEGYPRTLVDGKTVRIARLVLEDALGREIVPGLLACHHCDRPQCIRREHIYEGSHSQNMADMYARERVEPLGRRPLVRIKIGMAKRGTGHHNAIVNDEAVRVIRFLAARGVSIRRLADAHGLHYKSTWQIVKGSRWRHL